MIVCKTLTSQRTQLLPVNAVNDACFLSQPSRTLFYDAEPTSEDMRLQDGLTLQELSDLTFALDQMPQL